MMFDIMKVALMVSIAASVQCIEVTDADDKVNLGWPNFFNPEKAILRKAEGAQKRKKATAGDKKSVIGDKALSSSELELLEENRFTNILKDTQTNLEDWEKADFTIKDALRGALIYLDSDAVPASQTFLSEQELQTIVSELGEEDDVYELLSEATDDGLHLATPLFRQRHTSSLGKYGAELTFFRGEEPVRVLYYGNWCGRGGRVAPVDAVDRCCLEHAKCYGRQVEGCPDVWSKPYSTMYAWSALEQQPYCVRTGATCSNAVCACDAAAADCVAAAVALREASGDESKQN